MKRCPECKRDYFDDSLLYCLDDGTTLLEGPASGSEAATAIFYDASLKGDPTGELGETRPPLTINDAVKLQTAWQTSRPAKLVLALIGMGAVLIVGFLVYRYATTATNQIDS